MEGFPQYLSGIFALLLFTCFVKVATTLSIFRYGIGLNGSGFGLVIIAFSLALTSLIMQPQFDSVGGLGAVLSGSSQTGAAVEKNFRPFLEKHSDPKVTARLSKLKSKGKEDQKDGVNAQPFSLVAASFLISELQGAFQLGFILIIPFIIIDLLVTNILMAVGITQLSSVLVSLPVKLFVFFALDGWTLISEKLIGSYL